MDKDVLELPGVFEVKVFVSEFVLTVLQRGPIGVVALHWTDVLLLDVEAEFVVQIVGLNVPPFGVVQGPRHTCNDCGGHLQSSGVLIGDAFPRVFNGELGTVPIGVLRVAVEQHSEFVHPSHDLLFEEPPTFLIGLHTRTHQFESRCKGIGGRVIRVVAGWSVDDFIALLYCEIFRNGKNFIMGD